NTVTGKKGSLVVRESQLNKAVNIIQGEVFGISKQINNAILGHGGVGGALINQILKSKNDIDNRGGISLNDLAIANSKQVLLNKKGADDNWKNDLEQTSKGYTVQDIIDIAKSHHLENLIAVDNSSSSVFYKNYIPLVEAGFDLVSS